MEFDAGKIEEKINTPHAMITSRTLEFSDKCIHLPGKEIKTEYSRLEEQPSPDLTCTLKVFANGRTETDEGYVSIVLRWAYGFRFNTGCCIISVIDAYGNGRFTETFSIDFKSLIPHNLCSRSFHIDKYISRERLLNELDELLPNDVLTLLVDVSVEEISITFPDVPPSYNVFKSCFQYDDDGQPTKFLLDSALAQLLIKESDFFKRMLESPMAEKRTKTMDFDKKDFKAFWHIAQILMERETLQFDSISEIFDMYVVADKYLIPAVTETCTAFLKLCLTDHTVDDYFELANAYEIEELKDLLINEINLVKQVDFKEEIEQLEENRAQLKFLVCKRLWQYAQSCRETQSNLQFANVTLGPLGVGKGPFNFYK